MAGNSGRLQRAGAALVRAWAQRGALAIALLPLAWIYGALISLRRTGYRLGLLASNRLDCALIVVGNAVAGGAGKTPTTIGIVQHLRARGLAVGVVSRGYGRTGDDVQAVNPTDDAHDVGDEPLLIARATGVPVFVGRDRHAAAIALCAQHPQTQIIVCDDGLQHYALYRDIEVCVFDERGVGNGWLLPAGPLREPWPRALLTRIGQHPLRTLVLHTGNRPAFTGYVARRSLSGYAWTCDSQAIALDSLQGPVLALAGIAKPDAFFESLRGLGVKLDKTWPLPDHFDFSDLDTAQLEGYRVLCTEKDAVKLWRFFPQALAVPLQQTLEPAFLVALDDLLQSLLPAKLSSPHGHQNT